MNTKELVDKLLFDKKIDILLLEKEFKIACVNYVLKTLKEDFENNNGSFSILDDRFADYLVSENIIKEEDKENIDDYISEPLGYDLVKQILTNAMENS